MHAEVAERFWAKVDRSAGPEGCWPWTAAVNKVTGYGVFHPPRASELPRTINAHRLAAALADLIDLADPAQVVDHACHNVADDCPGGACAHRRCQNPAHLQRTTNRGNLDVSPLAHWHKVKCPRDHPYTPENTRVQIRDGITSRSCKTCSRLADVAPNRKRANIGR